MTDVVGIGARMAETAEEGYVLLQAARTDLERLTVRSPVAGQILQANLRPGEYVPAGPAADGFYAVGPGVV